ncbi:MAG: YhcH/YjgK/YiaL family protein, partial [Nitrospirae bacterium CG08_land_8_20_14_0_20_52_24]
MIVDELRHWRYYHLGSAWNKAFDFLISLTPDIEEGEYPL